MKPKVRLKLLSYYSWNFQNRCAPFRHTQWHSKGWGGARGQLGNKKKKNRGKSVLSVPNTQFSNQFLSGPMPLWPIGLATPLAIRTINRSYQKYFNSGTSRNLSSGHYERLRTGELRLNIDRVRDALRRNPAISAHKNTCFAQSGTKWVWASCSKLSRSLDLLKQMRWNKKHGKARLLLFNMMWT